jgi:hypothetical protein
MVGYGNCGSGCNGGGTTSSWWSNFTSWLGGVATSIGQLFGGPGGTNSTGPYGGFGGSIYPYGYFNQYPYTYTGNGGGGGTGILDCQGVDGGTAQTDVCGACVGGNTGLTACNAPTTNDTLKPIVVPCDTNAVKRDQKSDLILNFIKDSAITKNARDSAPFRNFEVSFSISKYGTPSGTGSIYIPKYYNRAGSTQNAGITYNTRSVADVHTHTDTSSAGTKICPSPSPRDYLVLLNNWRDTANYFINDFDTRYIIAGDSVHSEYAYVIEDTLKAHQFFNNHPLDSIIQTNPSLPNINNWRGNINTVGSYLWTFYQAKLLFKAEGYPERLLDTYANVFMLDTLGLDLGIKLQQKVDGQFKELKFIKETDPITGKKHYKITICQ